MSRMTDFVSDVAFTIGQPPQTAWRDKIRNTTEVMIATIVEATPNATLDAIQRRVIIAARVALGDEPDLPMVDLMLDHATAKLHDPAMPIDDRSLPGMFRIMLMTEFPGWRTSIQTESVMAVIQETLATVLQPVNRNLSSGPPWRTKIDRAARMMVAIERQIAPTKSPQEVRRRVMRDAKTALDPSIKLKPRVHMIPNEVGVMEAQECIATPGIIRLVLVSDVPNWRSPARAKSILAIVKRAIDDELN